MRHALRLFPLLLLAACGQPNWMGGAALDAASLIYSDKTIGDHIASYATGLDCSQVTYQAKGVYCLGPPPPPTSTVYCYRTLADVSCYAMPNPHADNAQPVGEPRLPVLPPRPAGGPTVTAAVAPTADAPPKAAAPQPAGVALETIPLDPAPPR